MRSVLVAVLLLTATATAIAQPSMMAPSEPTYTPVAPAAAKVESTATLLALGGTALGFLATYRAIETENSALGFAGLSMMMIGPSAGHMYAGEGGHAVKTSLLRAGGFLTFTLGMIALTNTAACDTDDNGGGCSFDDDDSTPNTMAWVGGAVFVGATLYDIYDAGHAVRRHNARSAPSWTVAPAVMSGARGTAPALAVSGSF